MLKCNARVEDRCCFAPENEQGKYRKQLKISKQWVVGPKVMRYCTRY